MQKLSRMVMLLNLLILSTSVIQSTPGDIVFDPTNKAQNLKNFISQMEQMKKQFKVIENQFKALTSKNNYGKLAIDSILSDLPTEWKSMYDETGVDYRKLVDQKQYRREADLERLANGYEESKKAYKQITEGFRRISCLMKQIDKAPDAKAAVDLQNRIAIEQANIQNNQTRLDMVARLLDLEDEINIRRRANIHHCLINAKDAGERAKCEKI